MQNKKYRVEKLFSTSALSTNLEKENGTFCSIINLVHFRSATQQYNIPQFSLELAILGALRFMAIYTAFTSAVEWC